MKSNKMILIVLTIMLMLGTECRSRYRRRHTHSSGGGGKTAAIIIGSIFGVIFIAVVLYMIFGKSSKDKDETEKKEQQPTTDQETS